MTLIVVLITFAIALALGGKLSSFERIDIRHVWVFPLAVVLMVALNIVKLNGLMGPELTAMAQPSIYVVIITALILNRHIPGTALLAVGTFMNFLVIVANRGYMPVSMKALEMSGLSMKELEDVMFLRHIPMSAGTKLAFLGDVIPIPWPHFLRCVGSIGDIITVVAMVAIVWLMFFPSGAPGKEPHKA